MQKILVPLDFSKESRYALKLASKIADKTNTEIYLLHMIQIPEGQIDMGSASNIGIPQSMYYIQKVIEKIIDIKTTFSTHLLVSNTPLDSNPLIMAS